MMENNGMKRTLLAVLALFSPLLFAGEPAVTNLDFAAGLSGWRNAYPESVRAEAENGRLTMTAQQADGPAGAVVQYFKISPNSSFVFSATVETAQEGFAFLNVKLNKGGKEIASLESPTAAAGTSRLEQLFHTGDADTAAVLCRLRPGAGRVGKTAVFSGLTLKKDNTMKFLLAGDSTVENCNPSIDRAGWGQLLSEFCTDDAKVINLAVGGRSTKSFVTEKRWERLLAQISPGDIVLIQFGHNDQKSEQPGTYAAADGEYQEYLKRFIADVRERKGEVILCTSVVRRIFNGDQISNTLGDYPAATRKVGEETATPVIDLYVITEALLNKYGPEKSAELFYVTPDNQPDRSHFNRAGAKSVAEAVAREIKARNLPGAQYMR